MKRRTKSNSGRLSPGLLAPLLIALVAAIGFFYWQRITDYIAYMQYTPPAEIVALAENASLRDEGLFYFYVSKPVLEGTQTFNRYCSRTEEKSAILGCYDGRTIYIYDVTDERLEGIEEVTAAHEMLHAVYDRLSASEKQRLEPLLDTAYEQVVDDELRERMAYYERNEPGQHYNELHSIIATEASSVPDELEQYYAQYFTDRQAVVKLYASYNQQFTNTRNRIEQLSTQLTKTAETINNATDQYNAASERLNADIQSFNRQAQAGAYATEASFYADRRVLVGRSQELATMRAQIERQIQEFEALRTEYETLTDEAGELQRSIDSTLAPAPAV